MHPGANTGKHGWQAWKRLPGEGTDGPCEPGLIDELRSRPESVSPIDGTAPVTGQLYTELLGFEDAAMG